MAACARRYERLKTYFTGMTGAAPLSLTKKTRNLAGLLSLAFFDRITCSREGSSGVSGWLARGSESGRERWRGAANGGEAR